MKLTYLVSILSGCIILIATGISPAEANDIDCGSDIGPNQTVILEHDIGPCDLGMKPFALAGLLPLPHARSAASSVMSSPRYFSSSIVPTLESLLAHSSRRLLLNLLRMPSFRE